MKVVTIVLLSGVLSICCGGVQSQDKSNRQSDRFYEAASIAWFEEQNPLAAIRNLTRAVETNPDNHEAHYLLGIIRLGRGEYQKAKPHLEATIRLRQNGDLSGLSAAENTMGVLLIHLKQYDEAIRILEKSSSEVMNKEPWLAFGNLGWAYIETGELDKAIEMLKRAMFDQPKYCVGLYRLGQAYYLKKEYEAAQTNLEAALAVDAPGCDRIQEAHHLLGMSLLREEQIAAAKQAFETCSNINKLSSTGKACDKALKGL